ncbi:MAG: hypothetical protein QG597_4483 [Actinomycetota bacterium]|nr:hypothetical protein [Actinomycetota bacterium]
MSRQRWGRVLACAVGVAVVTAGCGGLSSVSSNQDDVCATLAQMEPAIPPMLTLTNPEGTNIQARYAAAVYVKMAEDNRSSFNDSQFRLLERVTTVMEQYQEVLVTKGDETPLANNQPAFDSFQMNIVANYRILVDSIGCPTPEFLDQFPKT